MRRINHAAARLQVPADQLLGVARGGGVERGEGLIEEPERHAFGKKETRERGAPALALRELAHGQRGHGKGTERCGERFALRLQAGEPAGDVEVLVRREIVLERGGVPDVDEVARILFRKAADRRAAPAHYALRRREQAAEDAKQARLAAAVRAGDAQELAPRDAERQPAKERAAATLAVEPRRLQH